MVEQTEIKFIADDGKEFIGENAEQNCRDYERQRDKNKVTAEFERLDAKEIYVPIVAWFRGEDAAVWKVTLNSKKDYYTVCDYFKVVRNCCWEINIDQPSEYPCTLTLCEDCEYVGEYHSDLVDELKKVVEQLEV